MYARIHLHFFHVRGRQSKLVWWNDCNRALSILNPFSICSMICFFLFFYCTFASDWFFFFLILMNFSNRYRFFSSSSTQEKTKKDFPWRILEIKQKCIKFVAIRTRKRLIEKNNYKTILLHAIYISPPSFSILCTLWNVEHVVPYILNTTEGESKIDKWLVLSYMLDTKQCAVYERFSLFMAGWMLNHHFMNERLQTLTMTGYKAIATAASATTITKTASYISPSTLMIMSNTKVPFSMRTYQKSPYKRLHTIDKLCKELKNEKKKIK